MRVTLYAYDKDHSSTFIAHIIYTVYEAMKRQIRNKKNCSLIQDIIPDAGYQ